MKPCPLSVIVPVYNAENYIIACLDSIVNQSLPAIEIICVNDGSTDRSEELIETYRQDKPQITLINQPNQGVSVARNTGMQAAIGVYIGFVDADDTIDQAMFHTLYEAAAKSDSDVVISNFVSELDGRQVLMTFPFPTDTVLDKAYMEEEIMAYFLKSDDLNSVWNKLYKRSIIVEQDLKFPQQVALGEDGVFNRKFFSHASRAMYMNYAGYHYRDVVGSATRNLRNKDYFQRALEVFAQETPEIRTSTMDPAKMMRLKSFKLIQSVLGIISMYARASKEISLIQRLRYVQHMIRNPQVREALPYFWEEANGTLNRYEKFMIEMIRRRSILGLYCATTYSRLRNHF
ncbi:glycosyltransferase [Paenibacillus roseipurpureus]|uniref:Glycosyltransferase n=1 Tax=Paenibacillus roseopurpureus TaxID=2918901 RepID=A0AA96RJH9_9BACL|nr:glycosyltransferase [Paenibacillus sp. MBLB1832]WNR43805.1 glycosyltransferase [Paenibacillus sp. MBLB1832]